MRVVLLSGDLMLLARLEGAARQKNWTVSTATSSARVLELVRQEDCQLLVIDLKLADIDLSGLVSDLNTAPNPIPVVACGPHVHEDRLAAAREAGCDLVVTRGQFERDAETILGKFCEPSK